MNNNLFAKAVELLNSNEFNKFESLSDLDSMYPGFASECHNFCLGFIYDLLTSSQYFSHNRSFDFNSLRLSLHIHQDYEKLFEFMVKTLISHSYIEQANNVLHFADKKQSNINISELKIRYPIFSGTLSILEHCLNHFELVLTGKMPGVSVLFPNGNSKFLDEKYALDNADYSYMPDLKLICEQLIRKLNLNKPLKILEVGGGRGQITKNLLNSASYFEYHFTDISKRFVIDMKKYAVQHSHDLHVSQFDITKDPVSQGLNLDYYDIVLGLNVVHVAPNLEQALINLQGLLHKNGMLCLLENTKSYLWQSMIMGLTKGWWIFDDEYRTNSPLIATFHWKAVLSKCGYSKISFSVPNKTNNDSVFILAAN